MRLLTWHVGCFRRFPIASFLACLAPTTACVRTTEVQAGSAEPTGPAIYLALEAVDAPQCYFLPPAGDIRFRMEVAPDGTVKSLQPLPNHRDAEPPVGPAVDCIAAHLRGLRMPPSPSGFTQRSVESPHAKDLSSGTLPPFDRAAIHRAFAAVDLSECARLPGPRTGYALALTLDEGGVLDAGIPGGEKRPQAQCIGRRLKSAQTPAYNGTEQFILVPWTLPAWRP